MSSKLAKLGLAAVLAYGIFDGITYTSFFVLAFLGYEKSTGNNPAANLQALIGVTLDFPSTLFIWWSLHLYKLDKFSQISLNVQQDRFFFFLQIWWHKYKNNSKDLKCYSFYGCGSLVANSSDGLPLWPCVWFSRLRDNTKRFRVVFSGQNCTVGRI